MLIHRIVIIVYWMYVQKHVVSEGEKEEEEEGEDELLHFCGILFKITCTAKQPLLLLNAFVFVPTRRSIHSSGVVARRLFLLATKRVRIIAAYFIYFFHERVHNK